MKTRIGLVAMSLVVACVASTASATLINIDINGKGSAAPVTYSGAAAIGTTGDTWNGYLVDSSLGTRVVSPAQSGFLQDSAGAATTVKFQIGAVCSDGPVGIAGNALANDLCYVRSPNVTNDLAPPTSTTFTLQGLQANGLYDIYLYAAAPVVNYTSSFTVGATTKTTAHSAFGGTWVEDTNFVKFSSVAAGADGSLQGIFAGDANGTSYAVWSGVQIQSVPEPSTLVMLVVGLLGLLCYAWRKR